MREPGANDELLSLIIVSRFLNGSETLFQQMLTHANNQHKQVN